MVDYSHPVLRSKRPMDSLQRFSNAEPLKTSLGAQLAKFEAKTGGHRVAPFADGVVAFVDEQREQFQEGRLEI